MNDVLLLVSYFVGALAGVLIGKLTYDTGITDGKREKYHKLIKSLREKIHYWIGQKKYWYNSYCIVLDEALDLHRNIDAAELKVKELNTKIQEQSEYIVRLCDVVDLYRSKTEELEDVEQEAIKMLKREAQ